MKKAKRAIGILLAAVMCMGTAACGKKHNVENDELTLEIHIGNYGYGTEWLQPIIDMFLAEDWVQEKYPGLKIPAPQSNSERMFGTDRTLAGPTNTFDLFITTITPFAYLEKEYRPGQKYFENLNELYDTVIPGENVTMKEKMLPVVVDNVYYTDKTGAKSLYAVPWVLGFCGLLYNKTKFDELGVSVPRTTDELLEACDKIVSKGRIPLVFATNEDYFSSMMYRIWWAQYEGAQAYSDFYDGRVPSAFGDGTYDLSSDVVKQRGSLESMKVIESLIGSTNASGGTTGTLHHSKYVYENVNTSSFTQAQSQFLLGNGLMMPNGDFFETEMRDAISEGVTDTISFMRTPVISSIKDKTPSITDDAKLREVVDAIDAGETGVSGVTDADFATVKAARMVNLGAGGHMSFIPSYATAKEPAKDFLLFMASDKAINSFMRTTRGSTTPYQYSVREKDPELYNSFTTLHKDCIEYIETGEFLADRFTRRLYYFGGFDILINIGRNLAPKFATLNAAERETSEQIFEDEAKYWTQARWTSLLRTSGLIS